MKNFSLGMTVAELIKALSDLDPSNSTSCLPGGGAVGQVLSKTSDDDNAVAWTDLPESGIAPAILKYISFADDSATTVERMDYNVEVLKTYIEHGIGKQPLFVYAETEGYYYPLTHIYEGSGPTYSLGFRKEFGLYIVNYNPSTENYGFSEDDYAGGIYRELPAGGETGQILAKKTNNSYSVEWIDPPENGAAPILLEAINLEDTDEIISRKHADNLAKINENFVDGVPKKPIFLVDSVCNRLPLSNVFVWDTFIEVCFRRGFGFYRIKCEREALESPAFTSCTYSDNGVSSWDPQIYPFGGTTGQVLAKNSDAENDVAWKDLTIGAVNGLQAALNGMLPKSGGSMSGDLSTANLAIKGYEQFQSHYVKKVIGTLSAGTNYASLAAQYKDGTYHRMWRIRFPANCNFWGKIKITLYGNYSSFNASGIMSKSITCNFNGSSLYNNVGFYDGLGVNVEKDFRISEAIWNASAGAWEILVWQLNLSGNNSPQIVLEAWVNNQTYLNNALGIIATSVELTQDASYTAQKASSSGTAKTVTWADQPVFETPLGLGIADKPWTNANFLGKSATAADASKLNGKDPSFYLDYNNLSNKPTISAVEVINLTAEQVYALMTDQTTRETLIAQVYSLFNEGKSVILTCPQINGQGIVGRITDSYCDFTFNFNIFETHVGIYSDRLELYTVSTDSFDKTAETDYENKYEELKLAIDYSDGVNGGCKYVVPKADQSCVSYAKAQSLTDDQKAQAKANLGIVDGSQSSLGGKLDKLTYEWNKGINFGSTGKLYVGRFKMYDSNISIEFSCTTNTTYSGKLVIATQNGNLYKLNVYGDADDALTSRLFIKGEGVGAESSNRQWIQIYFNPPAWSKNIVHIRAQAIDACDNTVLCTSVEAVPSDYTNIPTNVLTNSFLGKKAKASDSDKLDGNDSTYYLDYNNLTNRPTIPDTIGDVTQTGANTFTGNNTFKGGFVVDNSQGIIVQGRSAYWTFGIGQITSGIGDVLTLPSGVGTLALKSEIPQNVSSTVYLLANSWSSGVQVMSLANLGDNDAIFFTPASNADKTALEAANCFVSVSGTTVTFTANGTVPTAMITLKYFIVRG